MKQQQICGIFAGKKSFHVNIRPTGMILEPPMRCFRSLRPCGFASNSFLRSSPLVESCLKFGEVDDGEEPLKRAGRTLKTHEEEFSYFLTHKANERHA